MPGSPARSSTGDPSPWRWRSSKLSSHARPTSGGPLVVEGGPVETKPEGVVRCPRAADSKLARSCPDRPRASASRRTVCTCAVRCAPRSPLLTARSLMPARSAGAACVRPARDRWCLSNAPKDKIRLVDMVPLPLPRLRPTEHAHEALVALGAIIAHHLQRPTSSLHTTILSGFLPLILPVLGSVVPGQGRLEARQ